MIYTAIYQNSKYLGEFSRAVVFNASFDRQEAWEKACEMEIQGSEVAGIDGDYLFCLVRGDHEVWSPRVEQSALASLMC